jgi:acetyl coenzyme A synthetase (ADP forming)-like protein
LAATADLDAYRADVPLADGRTVRIRPITPGDADALYQMWQRLSPETIRLRFFAPRSMTRAGIEYFTHLDMRDRFALVAEQQGRIIGVARFDRLVDDPEAAEFAVLVEDAEQGRGVGTALLRALRQPAQDLGVTRFVGEVLSENRRMLEVLTDAGFEPRLRHDGSVVHTEFTTTPTESFLAAADEQDRLAAVSALTHVLRPESVAVIGASRDPTAIGGLVFSNLLQSGFHGPVYPVNPHAPVVQSVAAYPSVAECPGVPECVVVCVPARHVAAVVEQAALAGTQAAVIVSAGFAEAGDDGAGRERELREVARRTGIRLVGPNCMGVLNAAADVRMNGTFSRVFPPPGRVAFSSQSGALGLAILAEAERLGVGLSSFASIGNKADLSGNDLLQYWEADSDTDVVLLYLESFGNPRKFGRIARRIGRRKPIAAVKSGRTRAGERAASSHTGALAAGDVAVDALFHQAGVIRCDSLEEMFHVAQLLANQPLPTGRGVAVLTNGGGPGILAADACESNGLRVPELAERTVEQLTAFLPPEAGVRNPVDMIASADAESYGQAMRVLADDPGVSVLLAIFIPPVVTDPADVAREVGAVAREINATWETPVPVLGVFMNAEGSPAELAESNVPTFAFPEDAARQSA